MVAEIFEVFVGGWNVGRRDVGVRDPDSTPDSTPAKIHIVVFENIHNNSTSNFASR